MPESPELKLMVKYINDNTKSKTFYKVEKSSVTKNDFDNINEEFKIEAESRGKELRLKIYLKEETKDLYMSMGMSGNWFFSSINKMKKHSHLNFYTTDGDVLCFVDPRRFGKWKFNSNWNKDRSPDMVLDYTSFYNNLKDNINNRALTKPICEVLMNQKYFNGIGNYLRAEILDRFDVDPFSPANEIVLNEDFLEMCIKVQEESFRIGGGEFKSFVNPNSKSETKGDAFVEWLQCYEKKKKIIDGTGRSFWYDEKWEKKCYYCDELMAEKDCYNEDGENAHYGCVLKDQEYDEARREDLDLMGF